MKCKCEGPLDKVFFRSAAKRDGGKKPNRRKQDIEAKRESEAQKRMRKAARRKRGNGRPQRQRKTEEKGRVDDKEPSKDIHLV